MDAGSGDLHICMTVPAAPAPPHHPLQRLISIGDGFGTPRGAPTLHLAVLELVRTPPRRAPASGSILRWAGSSETSSEEQGEGLHPSQARGAQGWQGPLGSSRACPALITRGCFHGFQHQFPLSFSSLNFSVAGFLLFCSCEVAGMCHP